MKIKRRTDRTEYTKMQCEIFLYLILWYEEEHGLGALASYLNVSQRTVLRYAKDVNESQDTVQLKYKKKWDSLCLWYKSELKTKSPLNLDTNHKKRLNRILRILECSENYNSKEKFSPRVAKKLLNLREDIRTIQRDFKDIDIADDLYYEY